MQTNEERIERPNVYGENHPVEEENRLGSEGVRETTTRDSDADHIEPEDSTAGDLDAARERQAEATKDGGMGRKETPNDETGPGNWHQPEEGMENRNI